MNLRILLLGCGDVGSAVAHRLFVHGADVVIVDVAAAPHPRHGMAFTDAWFDGAATLEGVVALLARDQSELATQLEDIAAITATPLCLTAAAATLRPNVLVDARMRKRALPEARRM